MSIEAITTMDFAPRPFEAAATYFAKKKVLTSTEFEQLSAVNKARAFRIWKVQQARAVQRVRDVLQRAIREGTGRDSVYREIRHLLSAEGVDALTQGHLQTVFRQNILGSYAAARQEQLDKPEMQTAFAYRRYLTVGNGTPGVKNVRSTHAALHGLVFRSDDPFWDRFTPPWEWGCRCTIQAMTRGQVERGGIRVMTYAGGVIRPLDDESAKGIALKPHPKFAFPRNAQDAERFDLDGLDAEIAAVIAKRLKDTE